MEMIEIPISSKNKYKCKEFGVSVVICCHNSEKRLPQTLKHLAEQSVGEEIPWEVIVIDNASTDNTVDVARSNWEINSNITLRVINEPKLGLINARKTGIQAAIFEFVSFIDDDNWVSSRWVETVFEIMIKNPKVGACGSKNEALCEITPPFWFEKYMNDYAVGEQASKTGEVPLERSYLWGAGLTIRKSAWQELISNGFRSILVGRHGNSLSSGEDSELCYALRLADWKLWYDSRLRLVHYIPSFRLKWEYLRRMYRGFGKARILLFPYQIILRYDIEPVAHDWKIEIKRLLMIIFRFIIKRWNKSLFNSEGNPDILYLESRIGRICALLHLRNKYNKAFQITKDLKYSLLSMK